MKKRKKDLSKEIGLIIKKDVPNEIEQKKSLMSIIMGLVMFVSLMESTVWCFIDGFRIQCHERYVFFVVGIAAFVFFLALQMKKYGEILTAACLFLYAIGCYKARIGISNGLATLSNHILSLAERYYGKTFDRFEVNEKISEIKSVTIFLLFVFVFLVGILAFLFFSLKTKYIGMILIVVVAFSPEVIGKVPSVLPFMLWTIIVFGYLISGGLRKKQVNLFGWKIQLVQLFIGAVILMGIFRVLPEEKYEGFHSVEEYRDVIRKKMDDFSAMFFRGFFGDGTVDGGINFGNIANVDEINFKGENRLRIEFDRWTNPGKWEKGLYLRGYVGSEYDGRKWGGLNNKQEKKRKELEEKSGILSENMGMAAAEYRMKLDYFFNYDSENLIFPFHKKTKQIRIVEGVYSDKFLNSPFDMEFLKKQLDSTSNSSNLVSALRVENVGETVSTLFVPYYVLANVEEDNGKLDVSDTRKLEYEWEVENAQENVFSAIANPRWKDDSLVSFRKWVNDSGNPVVDYYKKMDLLWEEYEEIAGIVKDETGIDVKEYEVGSMKGKSINELSPKLEEKCCILNEDAERPRLLEISEQINYHNKKAEDLVKSYQDIYCLLDGYGEHEWYDDSDWEIRALCGELDADEFLTLLKLVAEFRSQQKAYEDFVKDSYLDVPDTLKTKLETVVSEGGMKDKKEMEDCISFVQDYLKENTKYSISPGRTPAGKDFVDYFLFENQKGYCVHYASAATMLFRTMGIPARFVEGYYASYSDIGDAKKISEKNYELYLKDSNAHAWTEIYISGYGWVPVEVTSGYIAGDSNEEEETPTPAPTKTVMPTASVPPTVTPTGNVVSAKPQMTSVPVKTESHMGDTLVKILYIIGGIVFITLGIVMRYRILSKRRIKKVNDALKNNKIKYFYFRIIYFLKAEQCLHKNEDLMQKLQDGEIALDGIEKLKWSILYDTMNQLEYSPKPVEQSQTQQIYELYETLRKKHLSESGKLKKCYRKYLKCV